MPPSPVPRPASHRPSLARARAICCLSEAFLRCTTGSTGVSTGRNGDGSCRGILRAVAGPVSHLDAMQGSRGMDEVQRLPTHSGSCSCPPTPPGPRPLPLTTAKVSKPMSNIQCPVTCDERCEVVAKGIDQCRLGTSKVIRCLHIKYYKKRWCSPNPLMGMARVWAHTCHESYVDCRANNGASLNAAVY